MKIPRFSFRLVLVSSLTLGAAISQQPANDPFDRRLVDTTAESDDDGPGEARILAAAVEFVEVDDKDLIDWQREGLGGAEMRKRAQARIEEGKARTLQSVATLFRSGQRAKVSCALDFYRPTEHERLEIDPDGPPFPIAFKVDPVGMVFEADPRLHADGVTFEMAYAIEWSRHLGEQEGARRATERVPEGDVVTPAFSRQETTSSGTFRVGESALLSVWEPLLPGAEAGAKILVFLETGLVVVDGFREKTAVGQVEAIRLGTSFVELSSEKWHRWLREAGIGKLVDGDAWQRVLDSRNEVGTTILSAPRLLVKSGTRAKVRAGETLRHAVAWDPPTTLGGPAVAIDWDERELGVEVEVDPVMSPWGRVDTNLVARVASHHGFATSYRAKEGEEWVPTVQFPRLYESSAYVQTSLEPGADILAAVLTPATEDGSPDFSKKVLFFLHEESFDGE